MKKAIKWIVLIVLAVLIVGLLVVWLNLNHIIKNTVETQASSSLNLNTTLGAADLALFGGSLKLDDLRIASPSGFAAPQMFQLAGVNLNVSYSELRQQPIRVNTIRIDNPKLVLEQSGGRLNIKAAMDQMPQTPPTPPSKKRPKGEPIKLIINQLTVANTTVTVRPGLPGMSESIDIPIATVELQNIGTGQGNQNGAAIKDVTMLVISSLAQKAAESDKLPPELRQLLRLNSGELMAQVKQELGARISEQVGKKLPGELGQAVGNVLSNPKEPTTKSNDLLQQGLNVLSKPKDRKAPTTRP